MSKRGYQRYHKKQNIIFISRSDHPELDLMDDETLDIALQLWDIIDKVDPGRKKLRSGKVALIGSEYHVECLSMAFKIPKRNTGIYWKLHEYDLDHCEILILVGTPEIDLRRLPNEYRDNQIVDLLIDGELKTAAYKNNPHIHPNRTLISFCDRDIAGFPVTERICTHE